ncbi:MAG: glycosyltransferase [Crocinitomicaceae bacterium]|nr:glycosyltransferase [Crocinitomicaceae bacterium]
MKQKKLILLTSEFPYGNGETFLETEIEFLAKEFNEVIIFSSARSTEKKRSLPENVTSQLFSTQLSTFDKVKALFTAFSVEYKAEKKRVRGTYNLDWTKGIRNTMLISLFTAKRWEKRLSDLVEDSGDVELTFYSYWCTDTTIGLSLLQKSNPRIRTFSRAHGWDLYFEATSFQYQPFRALITENLSGLFPISEIGKDYVQERWKVEPKQIQVARLGTHEQKNHPQKPVKNRLVSCSNLVPLKRVELIAKALSKTDLDLEWFHFGDGVEMQKVQSIVDAIPSNIDVHLLGHKSNSEVLTWYGENAPSLFVNVSTTEGVPVSIMEAMSFGIPVMATNVGGTSEIVNSENGELLPADLSAELLTERIEEFFQSSEEIRINMGKAAFDTWQSKYNAAKNYAEFAKTLAARS